MTCSYLLCSSRRISFTEQCLCVFQYPNAVLIVGQRMQMMRGPPIAPPLPRPPPPPPMMLPPTMQGQTPQGAPQPIQHMAAAPQVRAQRFGHCWAGHSLRGGEPPDLRDFSPHRWSVCKIWLSVLNVLIFTDVVSCYSSCKQYSKTNFHNLNLTSHNSVNNSVSDLTAAKPLSYSLS